MTDELEAWEIEYLVPVTYSGGFNRKFFKNSEDIKRRLVQMASEDAYPGNQPPWDDSLIIVRKVRDAR